MREHFTKLKPEEIVKLDVESLYIGNLNTVDEDLNLPLSGKYGSVLSWSTDEERFIRADGRVNRPLYGMGNRKVKLRVRAVCGNRSAEREFEATVLQKMKENIVAEIREVSLTAVPGEKVDLPSVVVVKTLDGRLTTVPVQWEEYEPLWEEGVTRVRGTAEECSRPVWANVYYNIEETRAVTPERKIEFFPIERVYLKKGTVFYERQQNMVNYLLNIDDDQMLYNFRKTSGLDTRGAAPMTGWDEESCNLKGHTTGHYMSGLALAWGATGKPRFLEKIHYIVDELAKCQEAFAMTGEYHEGYLGAYSEEQFDLLEKFTRYPEIWAPYYTLDKIMSGLYDCNRIAGSEKAKEILDKMGDWVYNRLSSLSKDVLDRMWSMYIAGEFGGMIGTMVKLHRLTGKETHLEAAHLFVNDKLFYPMEENCDTLEDMHANQHIPQIMGAMDLFQVTKEEKWWRIGRNFWKIVTGGHTYCIGGVGETEMFHCTGTTCDYLTEKAAESCASYNMLRLTAQLFEYTADGTMMDYYDNTLRNHILTSASHEDDGGTTYFMPLGPGQQKEYSTTENTCCHGTGMESRFRYMENIYAEDEKCVYVNLLIDSVLEGETSLEIDTVEMEGIVKVTCRCDMNKELKIHIPSWAKEGFRAEVNREELCRNDLENGYFSAGKIWKSGDEIVLHLPMRLRILENPSDSRFVNLAYGSYILAALSDKMAFFPLPDPAKIRRLDGQLHFRADDLEFVPLCETDRQKYHVYFLAPAEE
ncbi:MAG: beta-L-arabinofuranosidase domain-containing protein [Bariatricus sp.]